MHAHVAIMSTLTSIDSAPREEDEPKNQDVIFFPTAEPVSALTACFSHAVPRDVYFFQIPSLEIKELLFLTRLKV